MAREVPDATLVLVGEGECRPAIEAQAAQVGIRERVRFTGTLPNSPLPQQLFDVCVLTSTNEGFPNSLVETSAASVALVSTRVGGVPDVLVEGTTGIGVAIGNVAGTAHALLTPLRDAPRRERMGAAGRALVRDRFSESAAVDRLLALYEQVRR